MWATKRTDMIVSLYNATCKTTNWYHKLCIHDNVKQSFMDLSTNLVRKILFTAREECPIVLCTLKGDTHPLQLVVSHFKGV